ncbi:thymidine kinase [Lactobacillus phage Lb338-1]|uniref:Thymidine kinase n=1 Tax=Lactobacillus phage Lb338-1 TaxID=2892342 RepID=C1KFH3_9CAUD|nr:thymidine kinase [Lactobacillus phage Lb338-1]ACO36984.1 thymidine kinase [Lactobacillus phage Lb338-1]
MAQLFFKYGCMDSGKTMQLLATKHNYDAYGRTCLIMSPSVDTRSGYGTIKSRLKGLEEPAEAIEEGMDIYHKVATMDSIPDAILVDESQFLSEEHIDQLAEIVDKLGIPVLCFGLKTDFQAKLFSGSKRLLEVADKIEEIKTICAYCNHKAVLNGRFKDGKLVTNGKQVQVGDEDYKPLCRYHYSKLKEDTECM